MSSLCRVIVLNQQMTHPSITLLHDFSGGSHTPIQMFTLLFMTVKSNCVNFDHCVGAVSTINVRLVTCTLQEHYIRSHLKALAHHLQSQTHHI